MKRILFGLVIIGCLFLVSCGQKQTPPTPPVPVNLFTVKPERVVYYDRYPATTEALSQVNLLPEVQGYITEISFKEGSHVKKGEKLYEIDKRLYQASYDQAAANLKVAQSNLVQAQQDADRYTYLNSMDAVAKQQYDHAMIALQTAKDQVKAAEETVKTAQTNLDYSEITAPFDGTIGFSQVKLGNLVTVGQTVLNTVSTDDPMGVDFLVNEKQLPYFEDLQNAKNQSADSLFTLVLPNNAYYPGTGQISVIDRAVDPQTGTIRVRIVFPNPKYYLRAGMSCVIRVRNQDTLPQIVIPNKAVVEQMGEFFVYLAKDTAMGGDTTKHKEPKQGLYAIQKKVKPGTVIGANIIIKSGLTGGEEIVVDGIQTLHNGSAITTSSMGGGSKKDSASGHRSTEGKN